MLPYYDIGNDKRLDSKEKSIKGVGRRGREKGEMIKVNESFARRAIQKNTKNTGKEEQKKGSDFFCP